MVKDSLSFSKHILWLVSCVYFFCISVTEKRLAMTKLKKLTKKKISISVRLVPAFIF
uniref:Uncharacterized protein n=1 Tax=Anguilla anguilla TaxID=7936 RepID=A0A0E9R1V0_ANGAN